MYSLREGIHIPRLDPEQDGHEVPAALKSASTLEKYDGFSFRHPKRVLGMIEASKASKLNVGQSLVECYIREFEMTADAASEAVNEYNSVVLWDRLFDEKAANHASTMYKAFDRHGNVDARRSCYVAGSFAGSGGFIHVYYGRVLCFLEHKVNSVVYMFALCDWAQSGL